MTSEEFASGMLRAWIASSISRDAMLLKLAVLAEFGSSAYYFNPDNFSVDGARMVEAQLAVRTLYDLTQSKLADSAVSAVRLYRGVRTKRFVTAVCESWTASSEVAESFDGFAVIEEDVPAKRILAYHAGPLWPVESSPDEEEYIVIGGVAND